MSWWVLTSSPRPPQTTKMIIELTFAGPRLSIRFFGRLAGSKSSLSSKGSKNSNNSSGTNGSDTPRDRNGERHPWGKLGFRRQRAVGPGAYMCQKQVSDTRVQECEDFPVPVSCFRPLASTAAFKMTLTQLGRTQRLRT